MILTSYVFGLIAFVIYATLVPVLLRLPLKIGPIVTNVLSAVTVHIVATITSIFLVNGMPYWQGAALYWFGFMAYMYFFGAFYKSVSLMILRDLSSRPDHSASLAEIYESCVKSDFVRRVHILVESGQVERQHDGFIITPAGRKTANRIRAVQRLFGIEFSGLYLVPQDRQRGSS